MDKNLIVKYKQLKKQKKKNDKIIDLYNLKVKLGKAYDKLHLNWCIKRLLLPLIITIVLSIYLSVFGFIKSNVLYLFLSILCWFIIDLIILIFNHKDKRVVITDDMNYKYMSAKRENKHILNMLGSLKDQKNIYKELDKLNKSINNMEKSLDVFLALSRGEKYENRKDI